MQDRKRGEPKVIAFHKWDSSATGDWSSDTGLDVLKDGTPEEIADMLWEPGIYVQNSAMIEFLAHGEPRKGAEVARKLVEKHPIVEKSLREGLGNDLGDYLLKAPLSSLPSKPEEYPQDIKVTFVQ